MNEAAIIRQVTDEEKQNNHQRTIVVRLQLLHSKVLFI